MELSDLRVQSYELVRQVPLKGEGVYLMRKVGRDRERWAIYRGGPGGAVLTKDDRWEYEPQPSSRDAVFLARARWSSAETALAFWNEYLDREREREKA